MSLELLRVEFRVVALIRDDEGVPTGEQALAEGAAYAAGLDRLPDEIRSVIAEAGVDKEGTP